MYSAKTGLQFSQDDLSSTTDTPTNDWRFAMRNPDNSYHNNLLAGLMASAGEHFYSSMEFVSLKAGDILYESESRIRYAYFPTTSVISLIHTMEDGAINEIAAVGNEGIVGVPLYMGSETTHSQAIVRTVGHAFRLKSTLLLEEFNRSPAIQLLLLRYAQSLFAQISQTAACNRHHSVHQQLCRWLLSSLDRQSSNTLEVTHESIACMLGVRRESITKEAGELQDAGIIQYARGHITIEDRAQLEAHTCECYHDIKKEFSRLLSVAPRLNPMTTLSPGSKQIPRTGIVNTERRKVASVSRVYADRLQTHL
jgi:CRP-like cAMP-binding protein